MSFVDIVKQGKYYFPANQRYGVGKYVVCDRCKRHDIPSCIGYGDMDLCLPCAEQVAVIIKKKESAPDPYELSPFGGIRTRMATSRFEQPTTLMATSRFRDLSTMTYMASDRFRAPIDYSNVIGWKSPYEEEIGEEPRPIDPK